MLVGLPSPAFAGSGAATTCAESFARWHLDIAQPPGGYVTIDFGVDGVDYTTTVWNSGLVGLGGRFPGTIYRIYWHSADGTVLATKGKGVAVIIESCPVDTTVPTTTPDTVPTTPDTVPTTPATVPTTIPGDPTTTPAGNPTTTASPVVTSAGTIPPVSIVRALDPTVPSPGPSPTDRLPETGPVSTRSTTTVAVVMLCLGMALLAATRRRVRPADTD